MNKNQEELVAIIRVSSNKVCRECKIYTKEMDSELASAILSAGYVKLSDVELDEEKLLVLMLNKIPSEYYNNPDKIRKFGDIFGEIAHAIAQAKGIIKVKESL